MSICFVKNNTETRYTTRYRLVGAEFFGLIFHELLRHLNIRPALEF